MHSIPAWYFTILLYFVGSTTYSMLQRRLAQKDNLPLSLLPVLFFGGVVYPISVVVALCIGHLHAVWTLHSVLTVVAASVLVGTFNVIPFHVNKHIDATQYVIINNIYTPVTVLLGVFALHERFTAVQFVGMVLLIFGALIVAVKGFTKRSFVLDRWSLFSAAMSLLLGVGLVFERASLNYFSASAYIIFGYGLQTLVTAMLAWHEWPRVHSLTRTDWFDIVKVGLARSGHVLGFILSVAISRNVAVIATVTSFRIPLVFIASIFVLHERDHLVRRFVGVTIATIGLILT